MVSQPALVQVEEPVAAPPPRTKRKLSRRARPDSSQKLRRGVQLGFLALNIWLGAQFYLFVRYYETGGATAEASRPAGIEGWLPIAALMNLKAWLLTGEVPRVHPAGMFLLIAFLSISFLLRKSFCSWLCPVGTISESLWLLGRKTFRRNFKLPRWADIPLRGVKYVLLALFVYAVAGMPVMAIRAFLSGPYGIVADVKMLNFFRYLSTTVAVVLGALVLLSVFVQNFWCRYLCPYGGLMGLVSLLSPLRIRREPNVCIDCAKCTKACPSLLPVDQLIRVRSAECTGCLECVAACPAEGALQLSAHKTGVPAWALAAAMAVLFFGIVGYARLNGHWDSNLPQQLYFELVPRAAEFSHP